jgi:hypothetical protein
MRIRSIRQLACTLIVILLVGCESTNKGKIEGTKWENEAATVDGKDLPGGRIKLEFGSDGKLVYDVVVAQRYNGTYSLGMGDNVTFNLDQEIKGQKQHREKISITGDRLTMKDPGGTAMSFSKVVENQPQANSPADPSKKSGQGELKDRVK